MPAPLLIRRANPSDLAQIVEYNAALAWESEQKRLDRTTLTAGVTKVLADANKGFYTVAEQDGEILGQILITYEWSDWRDGWYWWIQSVYVRSDARRKGIFRAIYQHLQDQAQADPTVIGLRLYVELENHRALATYQALGMTPEPYQLLGLYPLPGRNSAFE